MKRYFLSALLLGVSLCLFAQAPSGFSIGLSGGTNVNGSMMGKGFTPQAGYEAGLSAVYISKWRVGLRSGVQLSNFRVKGDNVLEEYSSFIDLFGGGTPMPDETSYGKISLFSVPLLLRYSYGNKLKIYAELGTDITWSLGYDVKTVAKGEPRDADALWEYSEGPYATPFLCLSDGIGLLYQLSEPFSIGLSLHHRLCPLKYFGPIEQNQNLLSTQANLLWTFSKASE